MLEGKHLTSLPKILLVDDDLGFAREVSNFLGNEYEVVVASDPTEGHRLLIQNKPSLMLLDFSLPQMTGIEVLKVLRRRMLDLPIIMLTGESKADTIIDAMKAGATDYVIKGSEDFQANLKFRIAQALERTEILHKNRLLVEENTVQSERNRKLAAKVIADSKKYDILGSSGGTLKLRRDILRLKGTNAFVLVTGENGTGKELIARNLNLQEDDPARPFVAINCAAIQSTLFESEFFGHMKGSFTGASENKIGQFKMADGGDIFLDEIGEVPLPMQAKLLRVLQEKTFTPVGGTKPVSVDVRVIAATNRNLEEEVQKGNFREDLYYRLAKIIVHVPSLRERAEDIVPLAEEFLKRLLPMGRLSEPAKRALKSHQWRGNIRELQNTIERAAVFVKDSSRPVLKPEHLGLLPTTLTLTKMKFVPENLLPQSADEISAHHRQKALDWIDRLYWERALKLIRENRMFYTLLGMSKTHYYERKKELFTENETEGALR